MTEPSIMINGSRLSEGQAMTIRVALNSFARSLQDDGLGDDKHGREMAAAYAKRLNELFRIIERLD